MFICSKNWLKLVTNNFLLVKTTTLFKKNIMNLFKLPLILFTEITKTEKYLNE